MTKADRALEELIQWNGTSEIDFYPYVRDFFCNALGYPKKHVRLTEKGSQGKIPDVSLISIDSLPKDNVFWIVCEVKKERNAFRSNKYIKERWERQLRQYISADTVFALFLDPSTMVVLRPDGSIVKSIKLDEITSEDLISTSSETSLSMLLYENSMCEQSLESFKEGLAPSRFFDVRREADKKHFYNALRISTRNLIDYSLQRITILEKQYNEYLKELEAINQQAGTVKDESVLNAKESLLQQYKDSIYFFKNVMPEFESQIGRQIPSKEKDALSFLTRLYATEGSSLVLARVLFVRFLEDSDMLLRKISNGGIKAYRDYHRYLKDDYKFLLTDAFKEAEYLYSRLFQPSIFDWSHEGDGELSKLLLRIFYRLNSFDFSYITGDILGNLYERFLGIDERKKLGEYYTPIYVAEYIIEKIGFYDDPAPLLDPACGSGTFLIAAAVGLIERLKKRGIRTDVAINQVVELIHGLDINVFAAFIAQLQLLWHLLPYIKESKIEELPELKIFGGINSLLFSRQPSLFATILNISPDSRTKYRDQKYQYVVGNPPYIRNERLKDTGKWRENYQIVDYRNSDIAYFFVARAIEGRSGSMPSWLNEDGRMCFVLPMGLCDSQAASKTRDMLMKYNILEITDLEDIAIHIFPSPQASGRATVAPILFFIEKTKIPNQKVEIVQVNETAVTNEKIDSKSTNIGNVDQSLFTISKMNPYGQFLTKIQTDDVTILDKLMNNPRLADFCESPTPTYGITSGRGENIKKEFSEGLLPLAKGLNVSTFYVNPIIKNWVDLDSVRSKSIWSKSIPELAYVTSIISHTLQCSSFNPHEITFNDSSLIIIPKEQYSLFPWDALINSSIMRFIYLTCLRTGLVGVGTSIGNNRRASWSHIYPRTLDVLPVSEKLLEKTSKIIEIQKELSNLAKKINRRWDNIVDYYEESVKKPLALHNIDLKNWTNNINRKHNFKVTKEEGEWYLRPYYKEQMILQYIKGEYEILNIISFILNNREENKLTIKDFQNLIVPNNTNEMSNLIDDANDPNSENMKNFKKLFNQLDEIIAYSYGINKKQWKHIQNRLAQQPFDVLQPRWPWDTVARRMIQQYVSDRFA